MPEPTVKLTTDAPVEMSLMRKNDDLIVHLVNHGGAEIKSWGWAQTTKYMPKIHDICLSITPGKSGSQPDISVFSSDYGVQTSDSGRIEISRICLDIIESVHIKNYF